MRNFSPPRSEERAATNQFVQHSSRVENSFCKKKKIQTQSTIRHTHGERQTICTELTFIEPTMNVQIKLNKFLILHSLLYRQDITKYQKKKKIVSLEKHDEQNIVSARGAAELALT